MEEDGENDACLGESRKISGNSFKYFPQKRLTVLSCGFFIFFLLYIFWITYLDVTTSFSLQSVYTFITPTNDNDKNNNIGLPDKYTMQIIFQNESSTKWSTALETPFSDSRVEKIEDDMPDVIKWYTVPEQYDKNDKWYLSVMSAFYDYRIEKIVVLLASDAAYQIEKNPESQPKFTCVYFYDNLTYTATVEGYFYTSYIFYCPMFKLKRFKNAKRISRDQIPEAVSLVRNDTDNEEVINWTIPVVNLYRRKIDRFSMIGDQNGSSSIRVDNARKLAICVGIMFGYQPWLTVLQFIEFHRMQGAEKFFFFYSNMHESTKEIFEWYKINVPGLIETIYWLPPHFTCDHEYRCQLLRDNYCSYALMHKYKYVANSDYDELFYPADIENKTLLDLLDEIDDETRGSFTFRAIYHQILLKDTPEWNEISADNASDVVSTYLPLYHFRNVSTMASHFYSPKTITKPETVLKRWIHFVSNHVKGTGIYHPTENEGFLRHFKVRTWWGGWADNADQEVKYHMVDPQVEIGNSTLSYLMGQISDVAAQCKLAKTN